MSLLRRSAPTGRRVLAALAMEAGARSSPELKPTALQSINWAKA